MIIAKSRIKHNGTVYEADELISEIDPKSAKNLVDAGVAVFVKTKGEVEEPMEEAEVESPEAPAGQEVEPKDPMAGVEPAVTWAKTRLLGFARAKGLEVTDEMTRTELYKVIKAASEPAAPQE